MNLGREEEKVEFRRSTSEMREGIESIASIPNRHGRVDEREMMLPPCTALLS